MRRRHHGILGVDRRSAGEMKIPHAKLLTLPLFSTFFLPVSGAGLHGTFMPRWAMVAGAYLNINVVSANAGTHNH
jgi:hypothetical protein